MEWALAIVALTLLGVATISRRLSGTPATPAMVFVAVGLLVGPRVLGEVDVPPHEHLIVLAIYLTVGLSVFAHGATAAPLARRYAGWYDSHPRQDKEPAMESAPADVTRVRGPAAQPAGSS